MKAKIKYLYTGIKKPPPGKKERTYYALCYISFLQNKAAALTYIQKPLLICLGITNSCPFAVFLYTSRQFFILAWLGQVQKARPLSFPVCLPA